ncbi:serine hydrolase [Chitinophaga sp. sic0106]|uniref:serine hydrolase domain-containing protein n=1 Tax=Chitinophaga sp. sic0106 TaxID=2854785 RepID=UPI001C474293|nr:serine hydrolase domain-containing protein [Chitinophaga sp. sic0106]MBV7531730.1 beta-lactamase family protein [Chitinophaga sp. sic0106]
MKHVLFTLLLLPVLHSHAQQLTPAPPEAANMSASRLTRIDSFINSYINQGFVNGAAAMVIRDGKIVYNKAFGYSDMEKKIPEKTDNIFRIASQTKAITSVAAMILYEEGKFQLDDPVSKYIPEFIQPHVIQSYNPADTTFKTVPATREITIRDLFTHTSGIGYAQIGGAMETAMYAKAGVIAGIGVNNMLLADKMKALGKLPLLHNPGEKWTYGMGVDVLGYLVEVLSGKSLDQFMRERIFEPLGMKDTWFYLPAGKQARLVPLYSEDKQTHQLRRTSNSIMLNGTELYADYPKFKGTYFSGGGGLSSTTYDYAIFLQMMLNGGTYNGVRILSRNSVRIMTMNQTGKLQIGWEKYNNFGLGFKITNEEGSAVSLMPAGSFQWGGMFATTYWADPKEKIVALIYTNIWPTSHGAMFDILKNLVYQAIND